MGTSSLRKGDLFRTPPMQQPRETIIAFEAARFGINSVLLVALPAELLLYGPWPRPHGRIFDLDLVGEGLWSGARPSLDEMQVLARSEDIGFRAEIGHVDDQGIALPMAARIAEPLTDAGRQVGAPVHDDVALPPLPLTHVVKHRDAARGLHDSPDAAGGAAKLGQSAGQAALPQRTVLRTVVAIHAPGGVARSDFRASRRWRRIVFTAGAPRQHFLAGIGRLQKGETKIPIGASGLLRLGRQRRNPAIGRIDNSRRTRPGALRGEERRGVVGAVDLALVREPVEYCRSRCV